MLVYLHHASLAAQTIPTSYSVDDFDGRADVVNYGWSWPMNGLGQSVGLINPASPDPVLGHGLFVYSDTVGWENVGPAPEVAGCVVNSMRATAISNSGQIVGFVECLDELQGVSSVVGFVFDGISYQYIAPPNGREYLYLTGINDSGTLTGYSYSWVDWRALPVIVAPGGTPQVISSSPLLGTAAYPRKINDAGYVVGMSEGGPFVYHNGTLTIIPVQAWGPDVDVNKYGHVVGFAWNSSTWDEVLPFLYRDGAVTLFPNPPGTSLGGFTGINDAGVMVGWNFGAFIFTEESGYVALNGLVDPLSGATQIERAWSINNAGQILAEGTVGESYGFLILTPGATCAPESSSARFGSNFSALSTGPRLTIVDPCDARTFRIDTTPAMSTIVARAEVTGVMPDPTTSLSYDWQAAFTHTTRQAARRTLTRTFEMSFVGSMTPPMMFFDPPTAPSETITGGDMLLKVTTTLPGGLQLFAERVDLRVLGTNPPKADIQAALIGNEPVKTLWLKKIACKESNQRQFSTQDAMALFQVEGEPLMNKNGDGGMGIMQYTENDPAVLPDAARWDLLWNWRKNVTAGISKFQVEKWAFAQGFPAQMRTRTQAAGTLAKTNQDRANQGLPPLDEVRIRDFLRSGPNGDELLEDAVRAYNGYGGTDRFGGPLHEFRLRTQTVAGIGLVFVAGNERSEGGLRIADAIWERVPVSDRPTAFGVPNYVELVRGTDPTCP